jgi:hypothetical protein
VLLAVMAAIFARTTLQMRRSRQGRADQRGAARGGRPALPVAGI